MRSVALVGVALGSLVGIDPFGWDQVGPLRWLLISACGFAVVATSAGRLPRDRLTMGWAALVAWFGVASVFGADRFHAWVGTPDRHFGWLTWLLCASLFIVARQAPNSGSTADDAVRVVSRSVVVFTLLGSAVAVAETLGWRLNEVAFAGDRLGGAFSQPALLGAASVLVLPIAMFTALAQKAGRAWRALAALASVGAIFTLAASQARAAWLAAVAVAALGLWARRSSLRQRGLFRSPARRALTAGAAFATGCIVVASAPVLPRLRGLFGSGGGLAGRVDEWQVAVRAIGARPITGWGPEGYRIAFGSHVDVEYVVEHGRRVITDRAHAGILDAAVTGGVPAALLYTSVLVLVAVGLWGTIRTGDTLRVGLALGALGYFIQQLVLFPLAELDPLAWLVAGLAVSPGSAALTEARSTITLSPVARGLVAGLAGVALLAGGLDVAADHRIAQADSADEPQDALGSADSARTLRGDSIRYDFIASRFARRATAGIPAALDRVASGLAISPDDPALRGEQARLLLDHALTTSDDAAANITRAQVAKDHLESLVSDDPNHPEHVGRLGIARAIVGDDVGAEEAFRHAIRLDPDNPDHQQNLATLLRSRKSS